LGSVQIVSGIRLFPDGQPKRRFSRGLADNRCRYFCPSHGFVTSNNFNVPRNVNTVWTGVRYAVRPNLDLSAGFYFENQNNYLLAPLVQASPRAVRNAPVIDGLTPSNRRFP
jgi:hypothetical protein